MDDSVFFLKPTRNTRYKKTELLAKWVFVSSLFVSANFFFDDQGVFAASPAPVSPPQTPSGMGVHTLEQALGQTYLRNPELDAARANLRATDESVAQAFSGWRPRVQGQLSQTNNRQQQGSFPEVGQRRQAGNIGLQQNLFAGGGTIAATQKAENDVLAGRQDLLSTEQQTLLSAVQAYMEVLTREKIVALLKESEKVLESTVLQAKARYEVGEGTRTEVASAEAKKAAATAQRGSAEGELETARANFTRIVGSPPGRLAFPKVLIPIPKGRQEAIAVALKNNPTLGSYTFKENASKYNVDAQVAPLLPSLDFSADANRAITKGRGTVRDLAARLALTIPIYDQGLNRSQVRQAEQGVAAAKLNTESARRSVIESTTKAWESHISALQAVEQYKLQVSANNLALQGVREEYSLGQKSLLDVLQVEDDWRQSVISLAVAEQNVLVSSYQLLASTGQMTVATLNLDVPRYDPKKYYEAYSGAWLSLGNEEDLKSFPTKTPSISP